MKLNVMYVWLFVYVGWGVIEQLMALIKQMLIVLGGGGYFMAR
jgi:hypothetical protein